MRIIYIDKTSNQIIFSRPIWEENLLYVNRIVAIDVLVFVYDGDFDQGNYDSGCKERHSWLLLYCYHSLGHAIWWIIKIGVIYFVSSWSLNMHFGFKIIFYWDKWEDFASG